MPSRRAVLLSSVAAVAARNASAASGKMTLSIHQNTSSGAGYRKSLEGWARAGIKNVEITSTLLDEFLKTDSLAAAGRVLTDLGLTPVSCACGVGGLGAESESRHGPRPRSAARFASLALTISKALATTRFNGGLQGRRGQRARRRGGCQTVSHDGDGRIPQFAHLDAADCAEDDPHRGPSEPAGPIRSLSLLVGLNKLEDPDPIRRRHRSCPFSGARHAARAPDNTTRFIPVTAFLH